MATPGTEEVIRTWFRRVWDERDPTVIDELFVPEGHGAVGLAETPIGPKEFRGFWNMLAGAIDNTSIVIDHLMIQGEQCMFVARFRGIHTKSGNAVEMRFAGHAVVRNGKIVDATNVLDALALLQQIGACNADALPKGLA
jgi:ketosteroid isomerase-like protein